MYSNIQFIKYFRYKIVAALGAMFINLLQELILLDFTLYYLTHGGCKAARRSSHCRNAE